MYKRQTYLRSCVYDGLLPTLYLKQCHQTDSELYKAAVPVSYTHLDVYKRQEETTQAESSGETDSESAAGSANLADGSYTIGIGQFAEHGSLDNCREGFLQGLAEEGFVEGENLTVLYQNAQADGEMCIRDRLTHVRHPLSAACRPSAEFPAPLPY